MSDEKAIWELFTGSPEPNRAVYNGMELIRFDTFPLLGAHRLRLVVETTSSDWPQAVRLVCDQPITINDHTGDNFVLWANTVPPEIIIECVSTLVHIRVFNAWDPSGTGRAFSGLGSGAMIVEELSAGRRYRCNDGYPDADFDDIVFRIERLSVDPR